MKYLGRLLFCATLLSVALMAGLQHPTSASSSDVCKIPRGGDVNGNGIGDAGVQVVCNYKAYYAYDANGDDFFDLGDGRIQGSVSSPDQLDQTTLSECFYNVHAKGSFEDDPYQDTGSIQNQIRCTGYDGKYTYNYVIVAQDDPRYSSDPACAVWGEWSYHVQTESGKGNLANVCN